MAEKTDPGQERFELARRMLPWRIGHWMAVHTPALYSYLMKGDPNTQRYWDSQWEKRKAEGQLSLGNVYQAIVDSTPERSRVLDVGCGAGHLMALLKERKACEVCGIDISGVAIKALAGKGFEGKVAVLPDIPYPENYFDAVTATEVLEHLYHPEKTVRSIARILKPGGKIFISVPDKSKFPDDEYEHIQSFSHRSISKLLSPCFVNIKIASVPAAGLENIYRYLLAEGTRSYV